ncbi:hypothetical protein [Aquabacterium commune]|nr:hypothetical protein [Aquabacterium commune]
MVIDYKIMPLLIGRRGAFLQPIAHDVGQFLSHLLNFLLPALAMAVLVPALARVVWWQALKSAGWWRQVRWCAVLNVAALVIGLLVMGRDGAMATYAGLVLASALTVWWTGLR